MKIDWINRHGSSWPHIQKKKKFSSLLFASYWLLLLLKQSHSFASGNRLWLYSLCLIYYHYQYPFSRFVLFFFCFFLRFILHWNFSKNCTIYELRLCVLNCNFKVKCKRIHNSFILIVLHVLESFLFFISFKSQYSFAFWIKIQASFMLIAILFFFFFAVPTIIAWYYMTDCLKKKKIQRIWMTPISLLFNFLRSQPFDKFEPYSIEYSRTKQRTTIQKMRDN